MQFYTHDLDNFSSVPTGIASEQKGNDRTHGINCATDRRGGVKFSHTPQSDMLQFMFPCCKQERDSATVQQDESLDAIERASLAESTFPPNTDDQSAETTLVSGTVRLTINGKEAKCWRPSVKKLLVFLQCNLTKQNKCKPKDGERVKCDVSFAYEDWLNIIGKENNDSNRREIKKRLRDDVDTLFSSASSFEEGGGWEKRRMITAVEGKDNDVKKSVANGVIKVTFVEDYARHILNGFFAYSFPMGLMKADDRNPYTFAMGYKLFVHYTMKSNVEHGTNNIVSVKTLMKAVYFSTKDAVKEKNGRQYKRFIINPFMSAFKELESIIGLKWNFCNAGKEPLAETQHPADDIDDFLNAYITFSMDNLKAGRPQE